MDEPFVTERLTVFDATTYRIVRLDFWDYRHPISRTFNSEREAVAEAERLNKINFDVMNCYIVERIETLPQPPKGEGK